MFVYQFIFSFYLCVLNKVSWSWSWQWPYGNLIYNYLWNQCLSPLRLRVQSTPMTTLFDKGCQWLKAGMWFSPVSSTNKTDRNYIAEILLKVALDVIIICLTLFLKPTSTQSIQNLNIKNVMRIGNKCHNSQNYYKGTNLMRLWREVHHGNLYI